MTKNYIKGSIREIKVGNNTKLVASLLVSDLAAIANERGYASFVIQERKDPDKYGNTHYAFENDYKPDSTTTESKQKREKRTADNKEETKKLKSPSFKEDLPF